MAGKKEGSKGGREEREKRRGFGRGGRKRGGGPVCFRCKISFRPNFIREGKHRGPRFCIFSTVLLFCVCYPCLKRQVDAIRPRARTQTRAVCSTFSAKQAETDENLKGHCSGINTLAHMQTTKHRRLT